MMAKGRGLLEHTVLFVSQLISALWNLVLLGFFQIRVQQ